MSPDSRPWSPAAIDRVRADADGALANAMATLAKSWCLQCGTDFEHMKLPGSALAAPDGPRQGLLLAAHDLMTLLAQSPQGRKALADLRLEPLFHQVEGERGTGG